MNKLVKLLVSTAALSIIFAVPVLALPTDATALNEHTLKQMESTCEHVEDLMPSEINMEILKARDQHALVAMKNIMGNVVMYDKLVDDMMLSQATSKVASKQEIYNNYVWLSGFNPEYIEKAAAAKVELDAAIAELAQVKEAAALQDANLQAFGSAMNAKIPVFVGYREAIYSGKLPIPQLPKHGFGHPDGLEDGGKPAK